ncbi:hypothetical protein [Nannocystis radixulma]|uniref:Myxococcus cysteine-rich repeat-containing protein n=1 Tax=Nannocystis radixulma TaxID=2995305 RepID=A0ABT5BC29_9BACT|nr:hypothetical protein [Nannocystis radixulma]MDC0671668.1 hypothetical protein [Nannocystis radixulma]
MRGCASLVLCACADDGGGTESATNTMGNSGSGITSLGTDATDATSEAATMGTSEGSGSATATGTSAPTTGEPPATTGTTTGEPVTSSVGTTAVETTAVETTAADTSEGTSEGTTNGLSDGTTSTSTTGLEPGVCGDGEVNVGEECDDGPANGLPPDATCSDQCTLNSCGDGKIDPGESCDLGPMNGPDNGCSTSCKILPTSCGTQEAEAELIPKPVDIIITIDNSGSMGDEIVGVQNNINVNFAQIIEASGLDYRVIMVSKFGNDTNESVCIEAPLGGIAQGGCNNPPAAPVNGQRFFHYSVEIDSHNSWCRLLTTLNGNVDDDFDFATEGWQKWLRADAFKIFLELTDDGVECSNNNISYDDNNNINSGLTAATKFDQRLITVAPQHFGDSIENRNYKWYSIVGMAYNNPATQPYGPMDPVITGKCPTAENNGTGYQTLSNMTGGLRFPLCDTSKYDVVFQAIANGVVADAKIACDFEIPDPPEGKTLDEDSIEVQFTPSGQMNPLLLTKVAGLAQCDPMSFYVENDKVILCPDACGLAQDDKDATLKVEFTCDPLMPL